jgi:hypothetical protein
MQTHPCCLPCFHRQAAYAAQLAQPEPTAQAAILEQAAILLAGIDHTASPPANAIALYQLIARLSGNPDPFAGIKRQSNDLALNLRPRFAGIIKQGEEPLRQAILLAMAGNIIDYGAQQHFDLDAALANALQQRPFIDDYALLQADLRRAKQILYLADNCGELVFDGLVIDQLPPGAVTMAVKEGPIINDATMDDARYCGLEQKCRVISNGTVCPGTPLRQCSPEFRELFARADVVISKGQGNFETLSEEGRPVYHLLTVKCQVVADHAAEVSSRPGPIAIGSALLLRLGTIEGRGAASPPRSGRPTPADSRSWPSPWPRR